MPLHERNWYRILSSVLAMLAGIGLVRYSYSPLIPAMLDQHWISASEAGYIGTLNFVGNLVGAIFCAALARRWSAGRVCRWSMLIGLVSVLGSGFDLGFVWLCGCRFLAGLTAAGTMILAPVIAVSGIRRALRSTVIGTVFVGAGAGVIGMSLLLPFFIAGGPAGGWWFTAALVLACIILSWAGLSPLVPTDHPETNEPPHAFSRWTMWTFFVAYLLAAVGIVPHSIYLSAYVHQALEQPVAFSTMVYAIYGGGVLVGGLVFGWLARVVGSRWALITSVLCGLAAVGLVLSTASLWFVVASGALLGAGQMGIAAGTTHYALQLVGPARHTAWWGRLTIGFNIGQAAGALGMGAMLHAKLGYLAGFWMGAGSFAASAILLFFVRPSNEGRTP
ncbi:MAG TPA: hypothetical protein DEO57_05820 [Phycisphaerales bacterium]|nr:hypothetical protein [Phycisphaerales bacterium]